MPCTDFIDSVSSVQIKGAPESDIRSLTEISQKSGMAPTTIRDSFREMVPFFVSVSAMRRRALDDALCAMRDI